MATNTKNAVTVGENVRYTVEGNELVVRIDLSHRGGLSATGKTIRVASTNGNKPVDGTDVILGINAYEYAVKK